MPRITLDAFIATQGIEMTAERVAANPNMDDAAWGGGARGFRDTPSHWHVTFTMPGAQPMSTYFSQGSAHTKPPTAADVLDCLASDASSVENARSFEDWANEMGYDSDSRKAERTYHLVEQQADRLLRFFENDPDAFDQLLYHTERL